MSTTVHEALMNAQINFATTGRMIPVLASHPIFALATEQLANALEALESGMDLDHVIQESLGGEIITSHTPG